MEWQHGGKWFSLGWLEYSSNVLGYSQETTALCSLLGYATGHPLPSASLGQGTLDIARFNNAYRGNIISPDDASRGMYRHLYDVQPNSAVQAAALNCTTVPGESAQMLRKLARVVCALDAQWCSGGRRR